MDSGAIITGRVTFEWFHGDGTKYHECTVDNLITTAGDNVYASLGAAGVPTGMKLGTGSTAVAKTGAGAALTTYLTGSNKAFDATYPSTSGNVRTYLRTYAAGEATSASPITEAVIVNDSIGTDATSPAANTVSRALASSPSAKGSSDILIVTWTHTILGA